MRESRIWATTAVAALMQLSGAVPGTAPNVALAQDAAKPAAAAAAAIPSREAQIELALQAAPDDRRAGAKVLGYDAALQVVELRKGSNDLVCLGDNPAKEKISVACYHASLEPFMARGRELRAKGETDDDTVRFREAGEGKFPMPKEPATLYVLTAPAVDGAGHAIEPYLRYVVYTPYATAESTGLPISPMAPGAPWIMFPGTAGAHIMIVPPKPDESKPAPPPAHP